MHFSFDSLLNFYYTWQGAYNTNQGLQSLSLWMKNGCLLQPVKGGHGEPAVLEEDAI